VLLKEQDRWLSGPILNRGPAVGWRTQGALRPQFAAAVGGRLTDETGSAWPLTTVKQCMSSAAWPVTTPPDWGSRVSAP